jgi:hypothetical protein
MRLRTVAGARFPTRPAHDAYRQVLPWTIIYERAPDQTLPALEFLGGRATFVVGLGSR